MGAESAQDEEGDWTNEPKDTSLCLNIGAVNSCLSAVIVCTSSCIGCFNCCIGVCRHRTQGSPGPREQNPEADTPNKKPRDRQEEAEESPGKAKRKAQREHRER